MRLESIKTTAVLLAVVTATIVLAILVPTKSFQKANVATNKTATIDSLTKLVDSLEQEHFVKDIQIGRYEHIFDLLETEMGDSGCLEKVNQIKSMTE